MDRLCGESAGVVSSDHSEWVGRAVIFYCSYFSTIPSRSSVTTQRSIPPPSGHANHRLAWTSKERTIVTPLLALALLQGLHTIFFPQTMPRWRQSSYFACLQHLGRGLSDRRMWVFFYPPCIDTPTNTRAPPGGRFSRQAMLPTQQKSQT